MILLIEISSRWWEYKKSAHMACLGNAISQLSLEISSICIPVINKDVNKCYGMIIDPENILFFQHTVLVVLARNRRWH